MSHAHGHHRHHHRPLGQEPGWSLLRLSAPQRLALVLTVLAGLWLATLAVIL